MNIEMWLAYLGTVLIFMSTPGPSHILMLSNSVGSGFNRSLATAAGDLSANFLQMLAAALGLVGLISEFRDYFIVIKWAGVAYLVYLGVRLIAMQRPTFGTASTSQRSAKSLYTQGFITSAVNPKAVIFFAALFPLFIAVSQPLIPQFVILSVTYLIIDGLFLCCYGLFAEFITTKLNTSIGRHFNKLSGAMMIAAAGLLGLKDIERY